ncbi:MAG: AMP-binding protein, partial [Oligoflexia bacterium]|nr:AMP-binding protein [Oligoflexia bacterium]
MLFFFSFDKKWPFIGSMNIANRIRNFSKEHPHKLAIISELDAGREQTFQELEMLSNKIAKYLATLGIRRSDKVVIFVRPRLHFPAIMWALFKLGAIPVLIDPGMGKKNLLQAILDTAPKAMIAEPIVFLAKIFYPKFFKSVREVILTKESCWVTLLRKLFAYTQAPLHFISKIVGEPGSATPFEVAIEDLDADDLSAILFTSGGTGVPKGVIYTHEIFEKQITALETMFKLTPSDRDLPGFPFFSLFTLAMGMSVVLPTLDPTKPSKANPASIVRSINRYKATFASGSPAIWERVALYCKEHKLTLPSLRSLAMFGAPIRPDLIAAYSEILVAPGADTYTPYGATEALPLTSVSGLEILTQGKERWRAGEGIYLGRPLEQAGVQIKIIAIDYEIHKSLEEVSILPANTKGEIIVSGHIVTKEYYGMPEKTLLAKIRDHEQRLWHRMGDVGYLDESGALWFCGRKDHVVFSDLGEFYPVCIEAIFNQHPKIKRSALIGLCNRRESDCQQQQHAPKSTLIPAI